MAAAQQANKFADEIVPMKTTNAATASRSANAAVSASHSCG